MKKQWLIIGGGPAGLQLAYFFEKNKLDYLILERAALAGSFFEKFPRHARLLSSNKVFTGCDNAQLNLRWDSHSLLTEEHTLVFKQYSQEYFPDRETIIRYLNDFAQHYQLKIQFNCNVVKIEKNAEEFVVTTEAGEIYECLQLVIASGFTQPYIPDIPGIEFTSNYYDMALSKKDYENKRVLIIGKGNSALETANHLLDATYLTHIVSPNAIKMAWRTHYGGDIRAQNHRFLETYQFKAQNAVLNAEILDITLYEHKYKVTLAYTMARGEIETREYDEIITCTGFQFDSSIFASNSMPTLAINNRFPELTSWYESVNIPNLYFIGTLMQVRDYKQKQSGFINGFRYNIEFLFRFLANQRSLPSHEIAEDIKALAEHIINRANTASSLWQQGGYLCDLIVVPNDRSNFYYYPSLPLDFVHECALTKNHHYFTVTLEYGQRRINQYRSVFAIERINKNDYANAHLSTSIHPVIRHYYHRKLISQHHIIEDLENVWTDAIHVQPLIDYLITNLAPIRMERAIHYNESHS